MADYDIADAFKAIEDELIASMMRNMKRHRAEETAEGIEWSMWQAEQLKALEKYKKENRKKYKKQFKDINNQIEALLRQARAEGNMQQELEILNAIKNGFHASQLPVGVSAGFFRLNDRKLDALIEATTNDMETAETAVLRMADDQYRKTIFNAQVYANTGAGTYEKAVDMATKDFLAAGLNCIVYANGARHTLSDYADMAIRTASKRAYLQGEGEKRKEWGIATVIVNKRGNPCPKCLPFCGKVLIDDVWSGGRKDGEDPETGKKYPLMSYAVSKGLYHPRCKDSHTTYFPGISTADDTWTQKELEDIRLSAKQEAKQQYAERQVEKFDRLVKYSLDEENRKFYQEKVKKWNDLAEGMTMALGYDNISDEDIYYIHRYMSFESYSVNEKLRNMEQLSEQELELIRGIDRTLSKLDDFAGEVYRSIDTDLMHDEEEFNKIHQPGNIVFYHAYTSASKEIYDEGMKYQLVIQSKRAKDISNINEAEKEVLFKRGSVFVVTGRKGNRIYLEEI